MRVRLGGVWGVLAVLGGCASTAFTLSPEQLKAADDSADIESMALDARAGVDAVYAPYGVGDYRPAPCRWKQKPMVATCFMSVSRSGGRRHSGWADYRRIEGEDGWIAIPPYEFRRRP